MPEYIWWLIGFGILAIIITISCVVLPVGLWFKAFISGAHVSIFRLMGMKLRGTKYHLITEAYINAKKAGLNITIDELETHYMAGGDVLKVVSALIAAHSARIGLSSSLAKAIDLAGRDVLSAVRFSVKPNIIETPEISVIASDGVELKLKVRITVRANLAYLVGGAGEETIISRVSEAIINVASTLGEHKIVLQNPDLIAKTVQDRELDAGTAFEIVSIDIVNIAVGRFVKAELESKEAEKNQMVAKAEAEKKRAMAVAEEQQMRAKTQEMKAQLLYAESEVPKAIAEAFRTGKIGVMDYYKMQNMIADTSMRKNFAEEDEDKDKKGGGGNGSGSSGSRPFGGGR